MLKSSVQKRVFCKTAKGTKQRPLEYVSIVSFLSGILAGECLLNARLEHSGPTSFSIYVIILFLECSIGALFLEILMGFVLP